MMKMDYVLLRALFPEIPMPEFQYADAHKYIHLLAENCEALENELDKLDQCNQYNLQANYRLEDEVLALRAENEALQRKVAAMEEGFNPIITEDSVNERLDGLLAGLDSLNNKLDDQAVVRSDMCREVIDFLTKNGYPAAAEAVAARFMGGAGNE